jgi:hypothetical protein
MAWIKKSNWKKVMMLIIFTAGFKIYSWGQGLPGVYVYPEKNQSKDQQISDENHCLSSAKQEVSENPSNQPQQQGNHKTLKRTGVGAGVGAIIGGGKGAAIGAGAGAISGRRSSKRNEQQANEAASSDLKRAYSSCLKSKGYSVE